MIKWFKSLFKHKELWWKVKHANIVAVKVKRDSRGRFRK